MDIEFGNLNDLDTNDTGWFIGFSDWTKADPAKDVNLRFNPYGQEFSNLSAKWMHHTVGETRGLNKPISYGRTITMLMSDSGGFRIEFSSSPDFKSPDTYNYVLKKRGDFIAWGANLYHQAFVECDSTTLTIRWEPSKELSQ
ncbi:MAG: hypothetical protein AAFZ35_18610 [Cyanobacteria bacterium J06649_12]